MFMMRITEVYGTGFCQKLPNNKHFPKTSRKDYEYQFLFREELIKWLLICLKKPHTSPPLYVT